MTPATTTAMLFIFVLSLVRSFFLTGFENVFLKFKKKVYTIQKGGWVREPCLYKRERKSCKPP